MLSQQIFCYFLSTEKDFEMSSVVMANTLQKQWIEIKLKNTGVFI